MKVELKDPPFFCIVVHIYSLPRPFHWFLHYLRQKRRWYSRKDHSKRATYGTMRCILMPLNHVLLQIVLFFSVSWPFTTLPLLSALCLCVCFWKYYVRYPFSLTVLNQYIWLYEMPSYVLEHGLYVSSEEDSCRVAPLMTMLTCSRLGSWSTRKGVFKEKQWKMNIVKSLNVR